MNNNTILKPNPENLKNAIAAILGRAIRTIKRFTTALHNRCNLVVYVDDHGRVCCQFLKKDAFSGYHFAFSGNECVVTNKESGEIYTVNFTSQNCTCPAYRYDRTKSPCKHIKMVGELRGDEVRSARHFWGEGFLPKDALVLDQQKECLHKNAIIGLDAHYCPDCKKSIEYGFKAYEEILNRDNKPENPAKKAIIIDTQDVPAGMKLKRTDDWMCEEYNVLAYRMKNLKQPSGELWRHPVLETIGRIVLHEDGIYTYRVTSGIARTFQTTLDAIAYLVGIVCTSFEEIAAAFAEREQFKKRVARL